MKDIYALLDEVEVNETEIKELEQANIEVTPLEKARLKQHLKKTIRKNKGWHNKGLAAAALIGLTVGAVSYIGVANPTYAAELPIVGDIFRALDNGRTGIYDLYKENANEINVTKENNGISMTIKEAIFDGKTISYTYEIKTDKDLGEHPMIGEGPSFNIADYGHGLTGSSRTEKASKGTYIGQESYSIYEEKDEVNCRLNFKDIIVAEQGRGEKIKGNWKFEFQLKAVGSTEQIVNKSIQKEGFTVTLNSLHKTPMSFRLDFTQQVPESYKGEWDNVTTTLEVKDNLGNSYKGESNGAEGNIHTGIMKGSMTFGKLDEKATQLIVTPKLYCSTMAGGVSFDENGEETQLEPVQNKASRELLLEDIEIEVK